MTNDLLLERTSRIIGQDANKLTALYVWGSRAYGTHSHQSDWDLICIGDNLETGHEYRNGDLNIHTVQTNDWIRNIAEHQLRELECLSLPAHCRVIDTRPWGFHLDRQVLRHVWSAKASNSWVKAKKKIDVEGEWYIGLKSLFHSLRIIDFATQLANTGTIDLTTSNHRWEGMKYMPVCPWDEIQPVYQPVYNELMTEFRKVAPK